MSLKSILNRVGIAGRSIDVESGDVDLVGGVLRVNGKVVEGAGDLSRILEIRITGGSVGSVTTDKSVNCENVTGDVNARGSVNADNIGGNVDAGGSVNCADVQGSVKAAGSVNCDDIGGSVTAGGSVMRG